MSIESGFDADWKPSMPVAQTYLANDERVPDSSRIPASAITLMDEEKVGQQHRASLTPELNRLTPRLFGLSSKLEIETSANLVLDHTR